MWSAISQSDLFKTNGRKCRSRLSLTAGDEPGSIIEVYRFAKALGFKVVAAGKGKNNPLNIYATPADLQEKSCGSEYERQNALRIRGWIKDDD